MNTSGLKLLVLFIMLFNSNINSMNIHLKVKSSAPEIRYGVTKLKELQQLSDVIFSEKNPDLTINAEIDTTNLKNEAG